MSSMLEEFGQKPDRRKMFYPSERARREAQLFDGFFRTSEEADSFLDQPMTRRDLMVVFCGLGSVAAGSYAGYSFHQRRKHQRHQEHCAQADLDRECRNQGRLAHQIQSLLAPYGIHVKCPSQFQHHLLIEVQLPDYTDPYVPRKQNLEEGDAYLNWLCEKLQNELNLTVHKVLIESSPEKTTRKLSCGVTAEVLKHATIRLEQAGRLKYDFSAPPLQRRIDVAQADDQHVHHPSIYVHADQIRIIARYTHRPGQHLEYYHGMSSYDYAWSNKMAEQGGKRRLATMIIPYQKVTEASQHDDIPPLLVEEEIPGSKDPIFATPKERRP